MLQYLITKENFQVVFNHLIKKLADFSGTAFGEKLSKEVKTAVDKYCDALNIFVYGGTMPSQSHLGGAPSFCRGGIVPSTGSPLSPSIGNLIATQLIGKSSGEKLDFLLLKKTNL